MMDMVQKAVALEIRNLTMSYHESPVLLNVNCVIPQGVFCALIGPNGAGKTTLLKSILGLEKPLAGSITVFGRSYKEVRNRVAYVPQRATVDWDFPATVFDVVMMGRYHLLGWFARPKTIDHDHVWRALEQVGMTAYAHVSIGALSGGQQQRVFLARALVQEADLYFMDEPFAGVDVATEQAMVTLLQTMCAEGKTVVMVHHDLQTVYSYFDWAVLINRTVISYGVLDRALTASHVYTAYGRSDIYIPKINNASMMER